MLESRIASALSVLGTVVIVSVGCGPRTEFRSHTFEGLTGRVLFVAEPYRSDDSLAVCALQLPEYKLEKYYSDQGPLVPWGLGPPPRIDKNGTRVAFVAGDENPGLFQLDTRDSSIQLLIREGGFLNGGTEMRITHYRDRRSGVMIGVPSPGVGVFVQGFQYGRKSGDLFAHVKYNIYLGTPDWTFSSDSIAVPEWMRERIRVMMDQKSLEWVDLIRFDSTGSVSLVCLQEWNRHFGFAVSPTEEWAAYTDLAEVHVLNLLTHDMLIPKLPEGFKPHELAFSPDGTRLAVEGSTGQQSSVIFMIRVPGFDSLTIVEATRRRGIARIAWSPDGKWLMLAERRRTWWEFALVAIEIESGREIPLPEPWEISKGKEFQYLITDGIDWIE